MNGERICYAVVFAAEAVTAWQYYEYLFAKKRSARAELALFTIFYAVLYSVSFFSNIALNAVIFFVANAVLALLCYRCAMRTAVLNSAFMTFSMVGAEVLAALLLSLVTHRYDAYAHSIPSLVAFSVLSKLLYFLITVIGARVFGRHKVDSHEPPMLLILCVVPLTSMIIAFTVTYIGVTTNLSGLSGVLVSFSMLALLLVNLLVLVAYNRIKVIDDERMALQISSLRDQADAEYYNMLRAQYESQRILVHDIKNHLNTLSQLAQNEDSIGVVKYIDELVVLSAYERSSRLCDEPILNMVLLRYSELCASLNIKFYCDVRSGCINFMDAASITALFGNLLSNAVEAAEQSEERFMELSVVKNRETEHVVIHLLNSCDNAPLTSRDGKLITRKEDKTNHGFGSKSVERIVKKYDGTLLLSYVENENRFHSMIQFPR